MELTAPLFIPPTILDASKTIQALRPDLIKTPAPLPTPTKPSLDLEKLKKQFEAEMEADWKKYTEGHGIAYSEYKGKGKLTELITAFVDNATESDTEDTLRAKIKDTNAYKNMKTAAEDELSSYKTKRNLAIGGGVLLVGGLTAFLVLRKK